MDPLKKMSVDNIEEYQLSLLSFSLLFAIILQVKVLFAWKIVWKLGKLNYIILNSIYILLCFFIHIGNRCNHGDCADVPTV